MHGDDERDYIQVRKALPMQPLHPNLTKPAPNGPFLPYTAPNGPFLPSTAPNGPFPPYTAPNGPFLPSTAPNGPFLPYRETIYKSGKLSQCSPSTPTYTVFISPFIVLTQTGLTVVVLPGIPMNNIIGRVQHWLSGDRSF